MGQAGHGYESPTYNSIRTTGVDLVSDCLRTWFDAEEEEEEAYEQDLQQSSRRSILLREPARVARESLMTSRLKGGVL